MNKEKIEEIKKRFKDELTWKEPTDVFELALGKDSLWVCSNNAQQVWGFIEQELSTLIQEERKEAVEGFVKYMERRKRSDFFINELINEYLESEGK